MDVQKLDFITRECASLFRNLYADTMGKWGKIETRQTVGHVAAFFNASAGIIKFDLVTSVEHLPKYKEFLLSVRNSGKTQKRPLV